MFNRLKKFFQPRKPEPPPTDPEQEKLANEWYEHKSRLLEKTLGEEHNMVMHAIIPYAIGGSLDLYYFPNGIEGTAIATKELSELPNQGSSNDTHSCYEIVMFTRHELNLDEAKDKETPFGTAHSKLNHMLNVIARYSESAKLNPNDTCEFPAEMKDLGGKCLIFTEYGSHSDDMVRNFGILAVTEVFRSEMEFARQVSTAELVQRLKTEGYYPYSDMERDPVA
jgi:hypothetical protein